MSFCEMIIVFVRGLIVSRTKLSLELLALRQQLVVLRRSVQRPQIQNRDRRFWIVVSQIWKDWRQALIFVKPETVMSVKTSPGADFRFGRPEFLFENVSLDAVDNNTRQRYAVSPDGHYCYLLVNRSRLSSVTQIHVALNWAADLPRK